MSVKLETEGFDRLKKWAESAPEKVGKAVDESMGLAVAMGEAEAKRVVPVRTGTLQRSIYSAHESFMKWVLGTRVFYGYFVEYGTSRMRARPFIRVGMAMALTKFAEILNNNLEKWLRGETE